MRWDELFDDLAAELAAAERVDRDLEVADRTRAEVGRLTLLDRVLASTGRSVTVRARGAGLLTGNLERAGAGWVLLRSATDVIVPSGAILAIDGLSHGAASPGASLVARRLSFSSALRALAVDRARATIVLTDGTTVAGTPDRVGSDFLDLAVHVEDVAPRAAAVTRRTAIPLTAIGAVARDGSAWE